MASKIQSTPPSWFDITKYSGAKDLSLQDWATQIGNRLYLETLLDAGRFEAFDRFFGELIKNPLIKSLRDPLAVSSESAAFNASYPSDKAIYPLTFGVAKAIIDTLSDVEYDKNDVCDEKLKELHPDIFKGQAHLFVNLRAPKTLLKKQFSKWLDTSHLEREHKRSAPLSDIDIRKWATHYKLLCYQDLKLWFRRNEPKIPSPETMSIWILNGSRDDGNTMKKWASKAFTFETYFELKHIASDSV